MANRFEVSIDIHDHFSIGFDAKGREYGIVRLGLDSGAIIMPLVMAEALYKYLGEFLESSEVEILKEELEKKGLI